MKINGKNVLVTGSNRGIGRAFALAVAEQGANLHLVQRTQDQALVEECMKHGALSVQCHVADLGSRNGVEAVLTRLSELPVDILFNNAGQLTGGLLEDQKLDDIYSMLQVNVNALIHLTHGFLPRMLKNKNGLIINHASVSAYMHFPCASTYSASKAAVAAFSECLRAELAGTGVRVMTLVTPGVETRMFNEIEKKYASHLDTSFLTSISPDEYAVRICKAIESEREILEPGGATGLSLKMAKHAPQLFRKLVLSKFKR